MSVAKVSQRAEVGRWLILATLLLVGQVVAGAEWPSLDLLVGVRELTTPVLGGDSGRYLYGPIQEGTVPYASYIVLTQAITGVGATPTGVVALQMLTAVIAARCLLDLGEQAASRLSGWFAAGWFLLFFQIAQWTRHILTESLFFSVTLILMWLMLRHGLPAALRWGLVASLLIVITFLRPNGVIMIGAVGTFLLVDRLRWKIAPLAVGVLWIFLVLVQRTIPWFRSHNDDQLFERFVRGEVFWNQVEFQRTMPLASERLESIGDFAVYVLGNPVDSFLLVSSRVGWELIQVRAWYADYYNVVLIISMVAFYALAAFGWYHLKGSSLNRFVWSVTVPYMLLIGFTWAIYEGRFAWWFLITWLPWVGIGADVLRRKLRIRLKAVPI